MIVMISARKTSKKMRPMMSREEPPRPCKKSKEFKSMATRAMIEPVCRVVSQEGEFEIYRPSGHIHLCSSAGLMITLKAKLS